MMMMMVAAAAVAAGGGCATPGSPGAAPVAPATAPVTRPATPSPTPTPPASAPTPSPTAAEPGATRSGHPAGVLRPGDRGPAVLALQQRLTGLGYWLGAADGRYGTSTEHAVVAFQKAARLPRDGVAGPVTLAALDRTTRLRPRSTGGRVVEVDLARQLLLVVADGRVRWVMDTSTGTVPGTTPAGRFSVYRHVDGADAGPLGVLYRPKYFIRGVAVHGYPSVPPYPASHGCVRVTDAAMDWLWADAALPIGGPVWVY